MVLLKWIGVVIEVAGAFMLAVEAIKMPNIIIFRDWLAKAASGLGLLATTSPFGGFQDNPLVIIGKNPGVIPAALQNNVMSKKAAGLWLLGGVFIFLAVGVLAYLLDNSAHPDKLAILVWVFFIGPLLSGLIALLFQSTVALLKWIQDHTNEGTVGILGFAFYFLSVCVREFVEGRGPH